MNSCKHFSWGIPALVLTFAGLGSATFAAPPTYILTDLGVLPGSTNTEGLGVNDSGQVAGSATSNGSSGLAFLSDPVSHGPLKSLGTLGSIGGYNFNFSSVGHGVNASGQVAGTSLATGATMGYTSHAFLSGPNGGALKDLGAGYSYSQASDINDSGEVTGDVSSDRVGSEHAFLTGPNGSGPSGNVLRDLGTLAGGSYDQSFGLAVNATGQVTGYSDAGTGGNNTHAFLSGPNGGPLKDLGVLPGGIFSQGSTVNDSGQVAGYSDVPNNGTGSGNNIHAFLSGPNGGPLQDLGTLPGGHYSIALGVNKSGQVVGSADPLNTTGIFGNVAFLYSGGVMTNLNTRIAPGSGFTLVRATHISNTGFITGSGIAPDGTTHAFLLTPGPVNFGVKISVFASASAPDLTGKTQINVTTLNIGSSTADMLQVTGVTLLGVTPFPAPTSPSPVPTTPNLLAPGHSQVNGFKFMPPIGTTTGKFIVSGIYIDTNTGKPGAFTTTIRSLPLPQK